jgi:hypothetical protein
MIVDWLMLKHTELKRDVGVVAVSVVVVPVVLLQTFWFCSREIGGLEAARRPLLGHQWSAYSLAAVNCSL